MVRGYRKEAVALPGLAYVDNDDHAVTGELESLCRGLASRDWGAEGLVVSYGDVLFRKYVLENMSELDAEVIIPVDIQWQESVNRGRDVDYVRCSLPYSRAHYNRSVFLERMSGELPRDAIHGEWMGLVLVSGRALPRVRDMAARLRADRANRLVKLPALLNRLVDAGQPVRVIYTSGNWLDVDSLEDVVSAAAF